MASNLSVVSGRPEMMYAGKAPWHGLGTYVGDKEVDAATAIKAAGMDWEVKKVPSYFKTPEGLFKPNGGHTIVRADKNIALGRVGDAYTPLQNRDAFKFMDGVMGGGNAFYHTAGALGKGENVWILVRFNGTEQVGPNDGVDSYLLLSNSHDGSSSVDIRLTTVRVVCANTLAMALSSKEKGNFFKFRHTSGIQGRVDGVQEGLMAVNFKFKKFIEAARLLRSEEINHKELEDFLAKLELHRANEREGMTTSPEKMAEFKRTQKFRGLVRSFEMAPGAKEAGTTLWGAVNAVTYYYDHANTPKDTGRYDSVEERRLASAWFGNGADKKEAAMKLALEFAGKR